jgi:signal transduction histidine kinase
MTGSQDDGPVTSVSRPSDRLGPAHARPRLWSSVRVRLLIPVLLATAAVFALGAVQVNGALGEAGRADRSSTLARAAGAVGVLAHEVATEYVQTNLAARRGTRSTVDEQVHLTDAARTGYDAITASLREAAPELVRLVDGVDRTLADLPAARTLAATAPDGTADVAAAYQQLVTALLGLAEALPPRMDDPGLSELARSLTLAAGLDYLAALQFDLVSRVLARKAQTPGDQLQLAQWVGAERTQVDALVNLSVGGESYATVQGSPGSADAGKMRQVLLDDRSGGVARTINESGWASAQSQRMQDLWSMEQDLGARLVVEADALGNAARERATLVAGGVLAVVAIVLVGAVGMVVRISRRLRQTRFAALRAARVELPNAIANVTAARDAVMVRAALTDSSSRVDRMLHSGPDEIGELSTAFGAVHRQALRLAADQALLRMEVQAMFVALSRRGQTLVQRQLHLIDEFGRHETDPDSLAKLFALDHLAARMRRNEENLLVLAGGEPGRWIIRPVAVVDLIRAAAQEIEEYRRVEVLDAPDLAVDASVAGDVIHLLAELLENATSYSPPATTVRVDARRSADGLLIKLTDEGIGMPADRLAEANNRLAHPSALTSTLVGTMGLLVVARLAQRHAISVNLESLATTGTTATVVLPDRLVMPLTEADRNYSARWLRELDTSTADTMGSLPIAVPAPAVTSLPPLAKPLPSLREPLPLESRPVPALEPPARSEAAVSDPSEEPAGFTASGLPRRPQETPPSEVERPAAASPMPAMPDPDAIRARLSSLAGGIAAAAAQQAQDEARSTS